VKYMFDFKLHGTAGGAVSNGTSGAAGDTAGAGVSSDLQAELLHPPSA
jgi:hypothetical protein